MDFPLARARIFWFIDKTAQPPHTHTLTGSADKKKKVKTSRYTCTWIASVRERAKSKEMHNRLSPRPIGGDVCGEASSY